MVVDFIYLLEEFSTDEIFSSDLSTIFHSTRAFIGVSIASMESNGANWSFPGLDGAN